MVTVRKRLKRKPGWQNCSNSVLKIRLDDLVVSKGLAPDRKAAQALIMTGKIIVNDQRMDKAGTLVEQESNLRQKGVCPYVSRGGFKLEKGLHHFKINPTDFTCLDIGASSGGFTDCLLQHGAAHVYAVDVAYGQLNWKIRQDSRVTVFERFNARKITPEDLKSHIDLAVMDVSFISLTTLLPPLIPLFQSRSDVKMLVLIKPQFELPRNLVGKNGVVENEALRQQAIDTIDEFCLQNGLQMAKPVASPILGPKGNKEYLTLITAP